MKLILAFCLSVTLVPGHVRRVIDGDTIVLYSVGVPAEERVRLLGVDAPERGQPGWVESTLFVENWLGRGPFVLDACKRDSFGRLLGVISRGADTLNVRVAGLRP